MHLPLVVLDEFVSLQQADTGSCDTEIDGIVSTEEMFEQFLLVAVGDAYSSISNRKEPMFSADLCGYGYLTSFGRIFQGIADQIMQYGINLVAINPNFMLFPSTFKL